MLLSGSFPVVKYILSVPVARIWYVETPAIMDAQDVQRAIPIPIKLACLCRQVRAHVDVPRSCFPLRAYICHSTASRRLSGLLSITFCDLPQGSSAIEVEGNTCSYDLDPNWSIVFCGQCGTPIYQKNKVASSVKLHTGTLNFDDTAVVFSGQCCADQTKDGGLSVWLDYPNSKKTEGCMLHQQTAPVNRMDTPKNPPDINASCHCGGVQFAITPPNEASTQISSPYSNLLVPYHSGSPKNEEDTKWWLRADGKKYFAGTCACTSCRLASGNDVQTWVFVPKVNIRQMGGSPFEFHTGALKQYVSSAGVYRNFCGSCSATIFWRSDRRPGLIDVSTGLLDAESGARAEELLEWATAKVSFQGDAQNLAFITTLGEGLRKWGARKQ